MGRCIKTALVGRRVGCGRSEQSVSPEVLPYIAQQGFEWICSDEAVLGNTLKHFFHRDEAGNVLDPEVALPSLSLGNALMARLAIVFRDHRLSDLIGFTYGTMDAKQASASDLVGHLEAISRSLKISAT
jgi:alpha-amylase/alpha-mannosidase (GH57 family)